MGNEDWKRRGQLGWLVISLIALARIAGSAAAPTAAVKPVQFDRDIRPILSDNCFACHGPDEKQRQVNLRFDTKEGAFADRGGYQVIVPGGSARSKLYQKISSPDQVMRMPPLYSGRSLTKDQITLIGRWIDEGAKWETHWAYLAPQRPALPNVRNTAWPRNPIDHFILARLESESLKPSPEADKATLLRRLSFDLTGLPPAPAEIDAFLADKSPKAYEKQVDRLLASPRYGERMAMQWLDVARYADTHGYHIDSHRDMWRWRDWLIQAFNRNLPYDEFTVEQLAGDLLPKATLEQKIATGFNRNHMINFEGGAIPEEYQNEYVVDRVEATANTWMGMTLGCARCHDHKYDPIRQKEFYQFYAFFNTIPEKGLDGRRGNAEPVLQLPSPEQKRRLDELTREVALKEAVTPSSGKLAEMLKAWEKDRLAALPEPPRDGLVAHYEFDGSLADTSGHYHHGRTLRGEILYTAGAVGSAADFSGEAQVSFGDTGGFDRNDAVSIALWARTGGIREMAALQKIDAAGDRRGFEIGFDDSIPIGDLKRGSHLYINLIHKSPDDVIQIRTKQRFVRDWHHIAVDYDGSGKAAGLKLYLDGQPRDTVVLEDHLTGSIRNSSPLEIGNKATGGPYKGQIDDLRLYSRQLTPAEIEQLAIHEPARGTLFLAASKRSRDQRDRLREYFLTHDAAEPLRELHAELTRLKDEKEELEKEIPTSMVMAEMKELRETFVLGRGDYRNKGEEVTPGVPSALPPLPKDAPRDRLGLARWLVDPSHPLTARVAVNRFWQIYFGTGIVKTAEDFGSQGDPPSHPLLLDWLATEFVRTAWDIKAIERLILTSATYRQSSRVTPELHEKDPENRLLARGPRFRLPAETVRDNALAVSGLLYEKMGGPGVLPYQPKGLWEDIAYGDVYSAQTYAPGHGQDLYRRSMYTFWKRTSPPPSLLIFDAPDREKCTARRPVTNTPLQALVLMNDPTYVEASRALAERMIREGGRDAGRRIDFAYRLATARQPTAAERQVLRDLAEKKLALYRRNPAPAESLLKVGESRSDPKLDRAELAAWTTVASVILNLDETITKE